MSVELIEPMGAVVVVARKPWNNCAWLDVLETVTPIDL